MCGIVGIVSKYPGAIEEKALLAMMKEISHRGPDAQGVWVNDIGSLGLGHVRLSIIDLSESGIQPMKYNDQFIITFNGEIYNYESLRKELEAQGYVFNTKTDTEVLLALYSKYKEKCLTHLDGMFAFSIWDKVEKTLFCARDRFGEKPFYYFLNQEKFVFASEMKALWKVGVPKIPSLNRFSDYFTHNTIKDANNPSATFYEDVLELLPSHYLKIDSNLNVICKRYWDIDIENRNENIDLNEASTEFIKLFSESIELRLKADVPVGSSLSGGLDSSSIVLLMNKMMMFQGNQNTFSARFKNHERDEGYYIAKVLDKVNRVKSFEIWVDADQFVEEFDQLCYHQEEPFGSASIFAQWKVMQLAKKSNVTVLLDGQGADEILGGYIGYYGYYLNQLFYYNQPEFKKEFSNYLKVHSEYTPTDNLFKIGSFKQHAGKLKRQLTSQPFPVKKNELQENLYKDTLGLSGLSPLQNLLRYADRNSMAHSR
ncbi:MAG TPA: asparagine synthase (glutamine-hydrolyzing), partial [Cytophagaceae bacterium]|nr:asparagine synthase (glutamine-hydrolyzing) [Cytophagaceae bacterium]